jgi:hypothetical protein
MWFGLPGDDLPAEAMPATRVAVPCARGRGPASSLPGHGGAGRRGLHPTSPFTISSVAPIRIPHPVSAGTGENEHNVRGRANSLFVNLYCPFIRHIKYALPSSVITFNFSSLLCHIIMHFPYSSDAGPPNIFFYSQTFYMLMITRKRNCSFFRNTYGILFQAVQVVCGDNSWWIPACSFLQFARQRQ